MKITPTTVLDFKVAQPADLPVVLDILAEAAAWIKDKGIEQWPSPPNAFWRQRLDCLASNTRLRQYYEDQGFLYKGQFTSGEYVAAMYEKSLSIG